MKQRNPRIRRPQCEGPEPVALGYPTRHEDGLPRPIVFYPSHYGVFFAFARSEEDATPTLCACSEGAIENYVRLENAHRVSLENRYEQSFQIQTAYFPKCLAYRVSAFVQMREKLPYSPGLCHRCNHLPPTLRYCHEMYGQLFKQKYGWYIEQAYFRLGLHPKDPLLLLEDICPDELALQVRERKELLLIAQELRRTSTDSVKLREIGKRCRDLARGVEDFVENVARSDFEFPPIGEGWVGEAQLAKLVRSLFQSSEILRHARPEWLGGLELDIFLPKERLAFEYQGQQHYYPVEAWGGQEALDALKERDARKKRICADRSIRLIVIDYREPLFLEHLRKRLAVGGPV
jgi:hypothetical protein